MSPFVQRNIVCLLHRCEMRMTQKTLHQNYIAQSELRECTESTNDVKPLFRGASMCGQPLACSPYFRGNHRNGASVRPTLAASWDGTAATIRRIKSNSRSRLIAKEAAEGVCYLERRFEVSGSNYGKERSGEGGATGSRVGICGQCGIRQSMPGGRGRRAILDA